VTDPYAAAAHPQVGAHSRAHAIPVIQQRVSPVNTDRLLERVHAEIHASLERAVAPIAHLERNWSEAELLKRLVKYMYRSASNTELLSLPWEELCEKLCDGMMSSGYQTSCADSPWFFHVDLTPGLVEVAKELIRATGLRVPDPEVEYVVVAAYEDHLDRIALEKSLWNTAHEKFSDEKEQKKVHQALSRAHPRALEEAQADPRPMEDITRVEAFTRRWIDDAVCRMWLSIPNSESVLTPDLIVDLFRMLIAPFGPEHPFSCIPRKLCGPIGPPPTDWDFVPQVVEELFAQWDKSGSRHRRGGGANAGAEGEGCDAPDGEAAEQAPRAAARRRRRVAGRAGADPFAIGVTAKAAPLGPTPPEGPPPGHPLGARRAEGSPFSLWGRGADAAGPC